MALRRLLLPAVLAAGLAVGVSIGIAVQMDEERLRDWLGALSGWVGAGAAGLTLVFLERQNAKLRTEIRHTRERDEQKRIGTCIAIEAYLSAFLINIDRLEAVANGDDQGPVSKLPEMSSMVAALMTSHAPSRVLSIFAGFEIARDLVNNWSGIGRKSPPRNEEITFAAQTLRQFVNEMKAALQSEVRDLRGQTTQ